MNQSKFESDMVLHKRFIMAADEKIFGAGCKLGEILALVFYDCRCVRCKSGEELQLHHIITRYNRYLMPEKVYKTQRHYWANIIVLCKRCHEIVHGFGQGHESESIDAEKIEKIKEKYGIGQKNFATEQSPKEEE